MAKKAQLVDARGRVLAVGDTVNPGILAGHAVLVGVGDIRARIVAIRGSQVRLSNGRTQHAETTIRVEAR